MGRQARRAGPKTKLAADAPPPAASIQTRMPAFFRAAGGLLALATQIGDLVTQSEPPGPEARTSRFRSLFHQSSPVRTDERITRPTRDVNLNRYGLQTIHEIYAA